MAHDLLSNQPVPTPAPAHVTEPAAGAAGGRPATVPEKFWDAATGQLRTEALLKSYQELERRHSALTAAAAGNPSADRTALHRALGVPEHPEGYQVDTSHNLFAADPEINRRLHAAGFTPQQVQLVYDLAAEWLVPLVRQMAGEFEAERQMQRLTDHFGGADKWREASRQMLAWGKKNLPPSALEALSTTAEGVMAIHKLMGGGEPVTLRGNHEPPAAPGTTELQAMMRDPRYWRDRDPAVVAKVTEGFQRLYPQG